MNRRGFLRNSIATAATAAAGAGVAGVRLPRFDGGDASADTPRDLPIRPPGALAEEDFLSHCIRCLRCVDACPNHAILPLDEAFGPTRSQTPTIKARRQACMLCNKTDGDYLKCGEACPTGALQLIEKTRDDIKDKVAIGIAEIDFGLCYSYNNWSCGACFRACPFPDEAMSLGLWERPVVHAEACVGCGLCERACIRYPHAIRVKKKNEA